MLKYFEVKVGNVVLSAVGRNKTEIAKEYRINIEDIKEVESTTARSIVGLRVTKPVSRKERKK